MRSLRAHVAEHVGAIEADLLEIGVDLNDLGAPCLTYGRLGRLLANLGPRSRYGRSLLGPEMTTWGPQERILADLYDVVALLNRNVVQRGNPNNVPRPDPYPRPWPTEADRNKTVIGSGVSMTPEELSAQLARPRVPK